MSESPVDGVTFRFIEVNDIRMRIAESGDSGPLILLLMGGLSHGITGATR